MTTDDDRVAYLEGEADPSLDRRRAGRAGRAARPAGRRGDVGRARRRPRGSGRRRRGGRVGGGGCAGPATPSRRAGAGRSRTDHELALGPPPQRGSRPAGLDDRGRRHRRDARAGASAQGSSPRATRAAAPTPSTWPWPAPTSSPPPPATPRSPETDSGWRIELDATGLPRLDNGRFYEAWLRNPEGILVSVGTFNEPTAVTLWSGVSPLTFTAFAVTEEEADGNPASSGRRVLTGQVDVDG